MCELTSAYVSHYKNWGTLNCKYNMLVYKSFRNPFSYWLALKLCVHSLNLICCFKPIVGVILFIIIMDISNIVLSPKIPEFRGPKILIVQGVPRKLFFLNTYYSLNIWAILVFGSLLLTIQWYNDEKSTKLKKKKLQYNT